MEARADAPVSRWWIDRSGRTAAYAVVLAAATAWATMLALPGMRMPGMGTSSAVMPPAGVMSLRDPMTMTGAAMAWSWDDLVAFTGAWGLMMAAMMLPGATPMIALHRTVSRRLIPERTSSTLVFATSYPALWALSAVPVYAASVGIASLVHSHRWAAEAAPYAVAATLLVAGAYQFTPLKQTCLANCRNPLNFLTSRWRPGLGGAARAGLAHAIYCLGCCAPLTVVLVAAGGMGLVWVLLIAAAVAVEKLAPRWAASHAVVGAGLLGLGAVLLLHPNLARDLRG